MNLIDTRTPVDQVKNKISWMSDATITQIPLGQSFEMKAAIRECFAVNLVECDCRILYGRNGYDSERLIGVLYAITPGVVFLDTSTCTLTSKYSSENVFSSGFVLKHPRQLYPKYVIDPLFRSKFCNITIQVNNIKVRNKTHFMGQVLVGNQPYGIEPERGDKLMLWLNKHLDS